MEESIPQKYCSKCEQWKPATTEYWHQGNSAYGLHGYCKKCRNVENPQKTGRPRREIVGPDLQMKPKGRPRSLACSKCGETDLDKFYYVHGRRKSICKKCEIAQKGIHQKAHPERHRIRLQKWREANPQYQAHYHLKWKYNLSPEEYQIMVETQFGLCAICGETPKDGKWHVDHCHTSGVVRGLLCTTCNFMLGMAKDNPEILRKAAKYLKLHET